MKNILKLKRRYAICGLILLVVAGYLIYMGLSGSVTYYVTVSELFQDEYTYGDTDIRVIGRVVNGSIDWNAAHLELEFDISEGTATLPVIYNGAIPDGFASGTDVLVEGRYYPDKAFEANAIMMRCPSKYVPEE